MLSLDESDVNSEQNNTAETRLGFIFLTVFVMQKYPVVLGASSHTELSLPQLFHSHQRPYPL